MAEDEHMSIISSLCRLCGYKLDKKHNYNNFLITDELSKKILKCFFINTCNDKREIHPSKICLKCYSTIKNIEKRGSKSSLILFEFTPHTVNCKTCLRGTETKSFSSKSCSKRLASPGRPKGKKSHTSFSWSKSKSLHLFDQTEDVVFENEPDTSHLPEGTLNCEKCGEILRRPVTVAPCDHSFCFACLLPNVENEKDTINCPKCSGQIKDIFHAAKLVLLLKGMKTDKTPPSTTTLKDILNIRSDIDISPEINDAVVHIIRTKMEKSPQNLQFKTGGRVS